MNKIPAGDDPVLTHKCVDLAVDLDKNLDQIEWDPHQDRETVEFQQALKEYLNFLKSIGAI